VLTVSGLLSALETVAVETFAAAATWSIVIDPSQFRFLTLTLAAFFG
jgi:hypothetical protein